MSSSAYEQRCDVFRKALAALIDEHWPAISPATDMDDPDDAIAVAEMGPAYAAGWVLVIGAAGLEETNVVFTARHAMPGQLHYTTVGLLADSLQGLIAP